MRRLRKARFHWFYCGIALLQSLMAAEPAALVDLDASTLATGALSQWSNRGSLGGKFLREVDSPTVADVAGVRSVVFDGSGDWLVGPIAPTSLTGNSNRTVVAWVYNPEIAEEETVIAWGARFVGEGRNASFIHGSHPTFGALGQWGELADVGWAGAQESNTWTCVAYRYDAATQTSAVFTNGILANSEVNGPLDTVARDDYGNSLKIVLGCQNGSNGTRSNSYVPASLAIGRLRVYSEPLSDAQIFSQFQSEAAVFSRVVMHQFAANPSKIFAGDSTTLSWLVSGAASVTLSPGPAIPAGATSLQISPSATTIYQLTALGSAGVQVSRSLTVTVDPGIPTADAQSIVTTQGQSVAIRLTAHDPNPPPGGLQWSVVSAPQHGVLSGSAPDLSYTPSVGFSGQDAFTFRVSDGVNVSEVATVSIAVLPPPQPPTAIAWVPDGIGAMDANQPGDWLGWLRAEDVNPGDTHQFELVAGLGDTHNDWFSISGNQWFANRSLAGLAGSSLSVRIRVTDNTGRSVEQVLAIPVTAAAPPTVVIHEIHYDPTDQQRHEFIELHNPGTASVSLVGWSFSSGISYTFPIGAVLPAGGFWVIAGDATAFQEEFGRAPDGVFSGKLSGEGETIELVNAAGVRVDRVTYQPEFPWPIAAAGNGSSMELIDPRLDNDLGGSWRSSVSNRNLSALTYVAAGSSGWSWRPGLTEASSPVSAWRQPGFAMDLNWQHNVAAPIGYGVIDGLPLNTTISGMQSKYRSFFARRVFVVAPGEIPDAVKLRYSPEDGVMVWLNGHLVAWRNVGNSEPSINTLANAVATEGLWYEETITNAATYLIEGENVLALQVFNHDIGSTDAGFDAELSRLASTSVSRPTPGKAKSVSSLVAPPQIRQVAHHPQSPASGTPTVVQAKITDPQGVASVRLRYQLVHPGNFIPATFPRSVSEILAAPDGERPENPDFEAESNWGTMAMLDDGSQGDAVAGDGVFTATLPGQVHRTLVRYRIEADDFTGQSVRVPYADDPSLNFAYFVYDGVPDFVTTHASVAESGAGKVWGSDLLTTLPVYHWLIRHEDLLTLQAYEASQQFTNNGTDAELAARRAEDWEGAFVSDGVVYDHVRVRLRGGNSRYGDFDGRFPRGKRHYKFRFNDGKYFQARDESGNPYPVKWKRLALNRMFGTTGGNGWGMPEEIGATLWRTFGVEAPETHWAHFRVIDDPAEAANQYSGDFWGLTQAVEEYDGNFLDAHQLTKGNLYKMSDWIWDAERQRRYQSPDMVRDGSEFNRIRDELNGSQSALWLQQSVDYENWYRYSAVVEAIRHYDVFPYTLNERHALKNLAWYFEPSGTDPSRGVCRFLPYDWDASFGPNFNNGWDHASNGIYGWDRSSSTQTSTGYIDKPEMKLAHRNVLREFRDLIWQPDQINGLLDDRAAVIAEFSKADQDRWRNAPASEGTANDDPLSWKVQNMKEFCFTGWNGSSGPAVEAGGRAAYLDNLADGPDAGLLPATPTISYSGLPGFPINGLAFQCSNFSDPQGVTTFAGMEWRIGRIHDPSAPAQSAGDAFAMEYKNAWQSGVLTTHQTSVNIPVGKVKPGFSYRARVRMLDQSGRWGHWSAPVQFTATAPAELESLQQCLMVTEIMYQPIGPAPVGGSKEDYEFIELQNISPALTLDLSQVRFTKGIDFDFSTGSLRTLGPGERVLVVKNRAAFESRYGAGLPIAGEWDAEDNLSNGGEQLKLSYGEGTAIHDWVYDDAAPWPTEPDGNGPSLVLGDPFSAPDHAVASNWRTSLLPMGSPGRADTGLNRWLDDRGINNSNAAFLPGMSGLMAYALGADLTPNPQDCLPKIRLAGPAETPSTAATDGTQKTWHLSHRRRKNIPEISCTVQLAPSPSGPWRSIPGEVSQVQPTLDHADGSETVTWQVTTNVASEPRQFMRLKMETTP